MMKPSKTNFFTAQYLPAEIKAGLDFRHGLALQK
jgi:hypothetical protein